MEQKEGIVAMAAYPSFSAERRFLHRCIAVGDHIALAVEVKRADGNEKTVAVTDDGEESEHQ